MQYFKIYQKIFYEISCFFSFEGIQCLRQASRKETLSFRSTAFCFPQKTRKTVSMKQQKQTNELMATKRKEYLCLISTDVNLDENEIVRIHEKHWDIEVFLKVCKSHLNLSREFNDNRSLGELFYTFQMKCPISHGYRLFKCCFKCSGQCFQTTPNFQIKKSTN